MQAWLRGDDTPQAMAGGLDIAEVFDMWRRVLRSKFEKKK